MARAAHIRYYDRQWRGVEREFQEQGQVLVCDPDTRYAGLIDVTYHACRCGDPECPEDDWTEGLWRTVH